MIPSFARVVAASCASTLTACVLWGGGTSVDISRAIDSVPAAMTANAANENANAAVLKSVLFDGRLQPCPRDSNCVSSQYMEPPNRYVSPLKTFRDRDRAFERAIRDLKEAESGGTKVVEILPRNYYIHATVPGTAAGSLDDIEIVFAEQEHNNNDDDDGGIVQIKCKARVTLPPPPFCLKKNCINGNMDQRTRTETIARTLGLPAADRERMQQSAKWTPIFFNSDRVPGFDDEF